MTTTGTTADLLAVVFGGVCAIVGMGAYPVYVETKEWLQRRREGKVRA